MTPLELVQYYKTKYSYYDLLYHKIFEINIKLI